MISIDMFDRWALTLGRKDVGNGVAKDGYVLVDDVDEVGNGVANDGCVLVDEVDGPS